MKYIFYRAAALAVGVAGLIGITSPLTAQHHGGGGGHPSGGGGGHPAVNTGSVHYGGGGAAPRPGVAGGVGREEPGRAGIGGVAGRSVRYAGMGIGQGGAYRNPYRDDYFNRFRPGYGSYILDGAQYYGYEDLPVGYQQVVVNDVVYYLLDGIYYQAFISDGQTVYLVVPPPQ